MALTERKTYFNVTRDHICEYCGVGYSSDKTLKAHMCVKKRRMAEKDSKASILGFYIYQRFFEVAMKQYKKRTFDEFANDACYTGYIRFANHILSFKPIAPEKFIDYICISGIKQRNWVEDYAFENFLCGYMFEEEPLQAVERTIIEMDQWSADNGSVFEEFFKKVPVTEAIYMIKNGRLSPWMLYLANSSDDLWARFEKEDTKLVQKIIDPNKWNAHFVKHVKEVKFLKKLIADANL